MTNKMFMKLKLTTLLAFVACAFISCAAPFELARNPKNVLYVSPTGSDATGWYGTSNRPWGTFAGAVAAARPGDKILFTAGNFTNGASQQIIIPSQITIMGQGTNSTFLYRGIMLCSDSNDVSKLSFLSDATSIAPAVVIGGNNYFHDLLIKAGNFTAVGGTNFGYNLFTNCVFATAGSGLNFRGTNFFYNCNVTKTTNTSAAGTRLLTVQINDDSFTPTSLYWSGGSLLSTTNGTDAQTNNYAAINDSTTGVGIIYLQNTTLSMPTTAFDQYTDSSQTNYNFNVTWSGTKTNLAAHIKSFAGFSNTNSKAWKFQASWVTRINTNAMFLLPAPPTNN